MADPCVFCGIASKRIQPKILFEDDDVMAFPDIAPQAPTHVLVIPKQHVATLNDLSAADERLAGKLLLAAARIARDQGCADQGYRLIVNCNKHGGQEVFHVHLHVLGGRPLGPMLAR
ncbi:MAG: histidine triad nucleotide-binding protein [Planctomycetota bacterium]